MKKSSLLLAILLISYCGFSQSLTGLWNGSFTNDSTTLRTDQPFEIALTEYRGKVYGYSRREFIKNDTLYYVLKRVKGKIDGDICEVTEDEYISHNFPGNPDKGVKITYTFHFNKIDSSWSLDGRWKTNRVVKRKYEYYALTGNVGMTIEKDLSKSKLFPHLEELSLAKEVPFYVEAKKQEKIAQEQNAIAAARKEQERKKQEQLKQAEETRAAIAKAELKRNNTQQDKKKEDPPAKNETTAVAIQQPVAKTNPEKEKQKDAPPTTVITQTEAAKTKNENEKKPVVSDVASKQTVPVTEKKAAEEKVKQKDAPPTTVNPQTETAKTKNENDKKPVVSDVANKQKVVVTERQATEETAKKQVAPATLDPVAVKPTSKNDIQAATIAAVNVEKRKSEIQQIVEFVNDSLTLTLYDNGEIDGDTVSVLINGDIIMANQGLKASAIKKTIYVTPNMTDSFNLVLYAENLGRYPPNTGLMLVRDGDQVYQVRFSADLQKNVAVIFKRKKK